METNPYSPSVQTSQFAFEPDTSGYTFKSSRVLSRWVIGLLGYWAIGCGRRFVTRHWASQYCGEFDGPRVCYR